jgi:hypothetical protein
VRRKQASKPDWTKWTDEDFMIRAISSGLVIESGSEQRGLPCVLCKEAIGGERAIMVALISPIICQSGGEHLNGAGFLRHETCVPASGRELASACIRTLSCALR